METRERIEEEFELEENTAIEEYSFIPFVIAVNYHLIADEVAQLGNVQSGFAVDIGTGLGDLAIAIAKRYPALRVIGVDFSRRLLDKAAAKAKAENLHNVIFQLADVHHLPLRTRSVDVVLSHGVLHHLRDLSGAFSEMYRILKPQAFAYLTDLRRDAPEEIVKEVTAALPTPQATGFMNSIHASYTPQELENILSDVGITDFSVSGQRFSRDTIIKNKDRLRKSAMRKADYTKLSQSIIIRGSDHG